MHVPPSPICHFLSLILATPPLSQWRHFWMALYSLHKLHLRCLTGFWIHLRNILLISFLWASHSFLFFVEPSLFGSSCPEVFYKKPILKFRVKHLWWSVILVKKSQHSTVDVFPLIFRKFSEQLFCSMPLGGCFW